MWLTDFYPDAFLWQSISTLSWGWAGLTQTALTWAAGAEEPGGSRSWHIFPTQFPTICLIPHSGTGLLCVCRNSLSSSTTYSKGQPLEIIRCASCAALWILHCPAIGPEPLIIAMVINLSLGNQPETITLILCRPLGNAENLGQNCIFVWKESLWTPSTGFNWTV